MYVYCILACNSKIIFLWHYYQHENENENKNENTDQVSN